MRGPKNKDYNCGSVKGQEGTECTQLAVGGQRYLVYQDACCRCCSWANGCGPIVPSWTENATYAGQKQVNGQTCDSYLIQGFQSNHLLQRANDTQLCELANADWDFFVFKPWSYKSTVDPAIFELPKGHDCSAWCGNVGDCKFGLAEGL